jgi:hypothetical protein
MRLSAKGLTIAAGLLWGGCLFVVGVIYLADSSYGAAFLSVMSSVYPGYYGSRSIADLLVGTFCGFVDGAVAGWLFAWLYNCFVKSERRVGTTRLDRAA